MPEPIKLQTAGGQPRQRVAVLGASGSIGRSAAAELAAHRDRFEVVTLAGNHNLTELVSQARRLGARRLVTADPDRLDELRRTAPPGVSCAAGENALIEAAAAPDVDIVLCAIVGIAGVNPVLAALRAGKRVALASKEVLVMAGDLVMAEAGAGGILPVDSEHSGVFQCLAGRAPEEINRICLTASGGPFLHWPADRIARATISDALAHPTWNMGNKVTIDSASMMNKALELIEAHHLFGVPGDRLGVVINPQSVMHAFIELTDGTVIAQLAVPDMRLAIRYALSYPERLPGTVPGLDWGALARLEFFEPDRTRFPALDFAYAALEAGGTAGTVMNAANDVAVERFKRGEITFPRIWEIIGAAMEAVPVEPQQSIGQLHEIDRRARELARRL